MKTKTKQPIHSNFEYLMWATFICDMQIETHDIDMYMYYMTGEL